MNLKFSRTQHEDHLFIDVTAEGLLIGITGGWSVGMLPQDATSLVKNGKSSKGGLVNVGGRFVLAHGDARLMLSANEVEQMTNLITKASWYG
ncbi:hypothetical protein [Vibrio vulnificus]|uniref:hypothetical protein n=1 Tax=Vibrio vulnificus TaxID=672 RepID=UPI00215D536F|nr:hypothetical protein [Vibrio vulnificus]MCR9501888.1 hypothetical protein [Vibrio vulnificus]